MKAQRIIIIFFIFLAISIVLQMWLKEKNYVDSINLWYTML